MNHILVVDDEPLMRTWLSKSIPKHSTCFDVPNTAQDGIEAIEYLKQAAYDVVLFGGAFHRQQTVRRGKKDDWVMIHFFIVSKLLIG